jgi:hypothetical protein
VVEGFFCPVVRSCPACVDERESEKPSRKMKEVWPVPKQPKYVQLVCNPMMLQELQQRFGMYFYCMEGNIFIVISLDMLLV